jgi:hypothetical protein
MRPISVRIPVAVTMAGGYGSRVEETVEIHARTVRTAAELCRRPAAAPVA